ncbi:peptidase S8/S53 domain-containing protein, partial [Diaporthe sp. PMI_573]
VSSTAAAKNCIRVGACESLRPEVEPVYATYGDLRPSDFPSPPLQRDLMADNPEGMAAFSSRGPTMEGRFKPDVVAPGTSILSAHSRSAPPSDRAFGTSPDPDWFFDSGTSMATPLVSGCAAVLRETLVKNGVAEPSAALVKALVINGAVNLRGQYSPPEVSHGPNNNDGFGRVNLAHSAIIPSGDDDPDGGFGQGGPLKEGDKDVIDINIPPHPKGDHPQDEEEATTPLRRPPSRSPSSGPTRPSVVSAPGEHRDILSYWQDRPDEWHDSSSIVAKKRFLYCYHKARQEALTASNTSSGIP